MTKLGVRKGNVSTILSLIVESRKMFILFKVTYVHLLVADELNEWLEKASENITELKKLSALYSSVRQETEIKCWQFIETRLSLLLGQYNKIPDMVSLVHHDRHRSGDKFESQVAQALDKLIALGSLSLFEIATI